jgi:uncharacterized protein (DUF2147 family)
MRLGVATMRVWLFSLLTLSLPSIFLGCVSAHAADAIAGIWLSDTRDGHVEIKPCGPALCGHIVSIMDPKVPADAHDVYNQQPNERTRTICGLQILGNLKKDGDAWEGWVYDPHQGRGRTYDVEIKLQDADTLIVHGYLGVKLLGETKLWTRASNSIHRCSVPPG